MQDRGIRAWRVGLLEGGQKGDAMCIERVSLTILELSCCIKRRIKLYMRMVKVKCSILIYPVSQDRRHQQELPRGIPSALAVPGE